MAETGPELVLQLAEEGALAEVRAAALLAQVRLQVLRHLVQQLLLLLQLALQPGLLVTRHHELLEAQGQVVGDGMCLQVVVGHILQVTEPVVHVLLCEEHDPRQEDGGAHEASKAHADRHHVVRRGVRDVHLRPQEEVQGPVDGDQVRVGHVRVLDALLQKDGAALLRGGPDEEQHAGHDVQASQVCQAGLQDRDVRREHLRALEEDLVEEGVQLLEAKQLHQPDQPKAPEDGHCGAGDLIRDHGQPLHHHHAGIQQQPRLHVLFRNGRQVHV
mmetsp:Transcript_96025/g.228673  ORF Transcript_96025/g.228673 Transcript_96025/m.228673 type:complete len:273 (-) Transcript_96025:464-1282(-)